MTVARALHTAVMKSTVGGVAYTGEEPVWRTSGSKPETEFNHRKGRVKIGKSTTQGENSRVRITLGKPG
jgi:hypothetical protein